MLSLDVSGNCDVWRMMAQLSGCGSLATFNSQLASTDLVFHAIIAVLVVWFGRLAARCSTSTPLS